VRANRPLAADLRRLDLQLPEDLDFRPGQFAMLNVTGPDRFVFNRPFSILATAGSLVSFLYRVVGRGTALLAGLAEEASVSFLGPLGFPFPAPDEDRPVVLVAGGVGLPPLHAWWDRYGRPQDQAFFGAREGGEVPWDLLADRWQVSVEGAQGVPPDGRVFTGLVIDLCREPLGNPAGGSPLVLACGPEPMLRAVAASAREFHLPCLVSLEANMGCGYGVCRGCVVPRRDGTLASACQDGPVFPAEQVDWQEFRGPVPGAGPVSRPRSSPGGDPS